MGSWILGLVLLAVVAAMLASRAEEEGTSNTPETESEGPARGVVVGDITDDPQEYTGATVTVSGEVNEVAAPNAFTVGDEDFLGTEELFIVGAQQLPSIIEGAEGDAEVQQNDTVQVEGTVRTINDRLFADYEGEPVVAAEKVWLTPRAERAGEDVPVSLAGATDDPEEYYGQSVTLEGVVSETIEPNAFATMDPERTDSGAAPADLAVLVASGSDAAPNLTEGRTVREPQPRDARRRPLAVGSSTG